MKHSPLISVIIPVYNREQYLPSCIDSILAQDIEDLEILIIDDGSTDGTWTIIQGYLLKHPNISAFRQERKRQGAARNVGLAHARGKYVSFVDSDDLLPGHAYQMMHRLIDRHQSDLVTGIKESFHIRKRWLLRRKRTWITVAEHERFFTEIRPNIQLGDLPELLVDISVCNKLFAREFLEKHGLRFVEDSAGEDIDFMARVYVLAKKISILPEIVYRYRGGDASRTSRIAPGFFRDRVGVTLRLESFFQKHGMQEFYPLLLLSEARKLVKRRLVRVIKTLPYGEQLQVFEIIASLVARIGPDAILESRIDLTPLARIRLLMLAHGAHDALISFTLQPKNDVFVRLLVVDGLAQDLAPLLTRFWRERKTPSGHGIQARCRAFYLRGRQAVKYLRSLPLALNRKNFALIPFFLCRWAMALAGNRERDRRLWLVDERVSSSAEDNGFVFYRYLKEKKADELTVHYLIDSDSPDIDRVRKLGKPVIPFSLRHILLLNRAGVLLSTDRFSSLAFPYTRFEKLARETHNVFLQHGVAANKAITYYKKKYPYFSQVIVSSEIEREFFVREYGFSEQEVTLTGIARFDNLSPRRRGETTGKILITPTWRKWLRTPERVAVSRYLDAWNRLLTSQRLGEVAEQHGLSIFFRPHFRLIEFIDSFETGSENIRILRQERLCLQDYIRDCDLLITDYSSVMYDFFFQEKPAIAYMFDRSHFEAYPPRPPLIDFDTDLPAAIAGTVEAVIDALEEAIQRNFQMTGEERDRAEKFFAYRDSSNCERIYDSVREKAAAHFAQ